MSTVQKLALSESAAAKSCGDSTPVEQENMLQFKLLCCQTHEGRMVHTRFMPGIEACRGIESGTYTPALAVKYFRRNQSQRHQVAP